MSGAVRWILILVLIGLVFIVYNQLFIVKQAGEDSQTGSLVTDYLGHTPQTPGPSTRMVTGEQAPDFIYPAIDGRVVQLSDFIGRKPVVLDFWSTRCQPCQEELPLLQEFHEQYGDSIEIIAVSSEQSNAYIAIGNTVRYKGLEFTVMHDPSYTIGRMYPHRTIPFMVFIDLDGNVVKTESGLNEQVGVEILETFGLM